MALLKKSEHVDKKAWMLYNKQKRVHVSTFRCHFGIHSTVEQLIDKFLFLFLFYFIVAS